MLTLVSSIVALALRAGTVHLFTQTPLFRVHPRRHRSHLRRVCSYGTCRFWKLLRRTGCLFGARDLFSGRNHPVRACCFSPSLALGFLVSIESISHNLSTSQRELHRIWRWILHLPDTIGVLFTADSLPSGRWCCTCALCPASER